MMDQVREIGREWTARGVLIRLAVFAAIWLVLAQGEIRYWGLVAAIVAASTLASLLLAPSIGAGLSVVGVARFIPFFLGRSVASGFDVARRAIARPPRVDPVYVEYRLTLTNEPARVLVANTMSLMPGTLSVAIEGDRLLIHVLDPSMAAAEAAAEVEAHAARMFGLRAGE